MRKVLRIPLFCIGGVMLMVLSACSKSTLDVTHVAYQAVRPVHYKGDKVPDDCKIAVGYTISVKGELTVLVQNKTSEIMIIDQTQSFFVDSNGHSQSYYDPTVRTTSSTDFNSGTNGMSVNLGAIGGALGIGGTVGTLMNGIDVGGSKTDGTSTTHTTYFADQPRISLAPRSSGAMSKNFGISGIGYDAMSSPYVPSSVEFTDSTTPCKFSVCVSYSIDNGATFDKIVTDLFVNAQLMSKVEKFGYVNAALRKIYQSKPDALSEPWDRLYIINTTNVNGYNCYGGGILWDFK